MFYPCLSVSSCLINQHICHALDVVLLPMWSSMDIFLLARFVLDVRAVKSAILLAEIRRISWRIFLSESLSMEWEELQDLSESCRVLFLIEENYSILIVSLAYINILTLRHYNLRKLDLIEIEYIEDNTPHDCYIFHIIARFSTLLKHRYCLL